MRYTKEQLAAIRSEIAFTVEAIAKRHNLVVAKTNASYGDKLSISYEFAAVNEDGILDSSESKAFTVNAFLFDLKPEWLGKTFKNLNVEYQIIGLRPRARKAPVVCKRVDTGQRYVFPASTIAVRMGGK